MPPQEIKPHCLKVARKPCYQQPLPWIVRVHLHCCILCPTEAKRIAQQNRTLVLGSDGRYHGPEVSPESAAATERWLALREGLESLCRIDTDPESLIGCVPHYQHQNLSAWLAQAVPLITRFDQVWKGARHA